jgi:hypothetical protein
LVAPSGSYRISAYSTAAQALGRPILVVSNSEHSLVADIANGITVDFEQPEAALEIILGALEGKAVACVLATDDSCVALCSRIAGRLGLPHNTTEAAAITNRKDLGRAALKNAGCNTPQFQLVELGSTDPVLLTVPFPVVVKPLALSASRGVIRANDEAEFVAACRRIDGILETAGVSGFNRRHLLVESYIDGEEYAIEGFMVDGEFRLLTIFDKPEPLTGPYFEETYYITPTRDAARDRGARATGRRGCQMLSCLWPRTGAGACGSAHDSRRAGFARTGRAHHRRAMRSADRIFAAAKTRGTGYPGHVRHNTGTR